MDGSLKLQQKNATNFYRSGFFLQGLADRCRQDLGVGFIGLTIIINDARELGDILITSMKRQGWVSKLDNEQETKGPRVGIGTTEK